MVYQVTNIVRDVRTAIDQNKNDVQLIKLDDIDTLMLDDIIESKVEEAVRRVVVAAPVHMISGGKPIGDAIYWEILCSGWTILPDDFCRFIVWKMSDWERPVYAAITEDDPRYQLQSSRYKGLRGNPQKPVVAIVRRQEGLILEFYSCKSEGATVEQGLYYPTPKIDKLGGIEMPEHLYKAAIYQAASLALATIGETDLSNVMNELIKELLQ